MLSIVFGLIAMSLGFWSMVKYWWYVVDVMIALLPLLLLSGGVIALMAGVRNTGMRNALNTRKQTSPEPDVSRRKKDE